MRVVTDRCDVTDEGQVHAIVQKGLKEFGRIDVVVNNAGWRARGALLDITSESWHATLATNLHAPFLLCKAVIPCMVAQRWGRRGIAREYGKHNITANCIGAGGIETEEAEGRHVFPPGDRDPIPRWGRPEEIAFLTVSLCREEARYVTGQCLLANGGKYFL